MAVVQYLHHKVEIYTLKVFRSLRLVATLRADSTGLSHVPKFKKHGGRIEVTDKGDKAHCYVTAFGIDTSFETDQVVMAEHIAVNEWSHHVGREADRLLTGFDRYQKEKGQ